MLINARESYRLSSSLIGLKSSVQCQPGKTIALASRHQLFQSLQSHQQQQASLDDRKCRRQLEQIVREGHQESNLPQPCPLLGHGSGGSLSSHSPMGSRSFSSLQWPPRYRLTVHINTPGVTCTGLSPSGGLLGHRRAAVQTYARKSTGGSSKQPPPANRPPQRLGQGPLHLAKVAELADVLRRMPEDEMFAHVMRMALKDASGNPLPESDFTRRMCTLPWRRPGAARMQATSPAPTTGQGISGHQPYSQVQGDGLPAAVPPQPTAEHAPPSASVQSADLAPIGLSSANACTSAPGPNSPAAIPAILPLRRRCRQSSEATSVQPPAAASVAATEAGALTGADSAVHLADAAGSVESTGAKDAEDDCTDATAHSTGNSTPAAIEAAILPAGIESSPLAAAGEASGTAGKAPRKTRRTKGATAEPAPSPVPEPEPAAAAPVSMRKRKAAGAAKSLATQALPPSEASASTGVAGLVASVSHPAPTASEHHQRPASASEAGMHSTAAVPGSASGSGAAVVVDSAAPDTAESSSLTAAGPSSTVASTGTGTEPPAGEPFDAVVQAAASMQAASVPRKSRRTRVVLSEVAPAVKAEVAPAVKGGPAAGDAFEAESAATAITSMRISRPRATSSKAAATAAAHTEKPAASSSVAGSASGSDGEDAVPASDSEDTKVTKRTRSSNRSKAAASEPDAQVPKLRQRKGSSKVAATNMAFQGFPAVFTPSLAGVGYKPPEANHEAHVPGLLGDGPMLSGSKAFEAGPVTLGAAGTLGAQYALASVAHVCSLSELDELCKMLEGLPGSAPVMLHMDTRQRSVAEGMPKARLQQAGTADTDASSPVASDAAAEPIRPLTRSVLSPEDEQLLGTYDYGSMAQGTEQLDTLVLAWHDSSVGSSPACTLLHVAVVGISKAESGTTADALSSDQVLSALWFVLLLPSRSWPLVTHALKPLHKLAAQAGLTPLQDHSLLDDNLIAGFLLDQDKFQRASDPGSQRDALTEVAKAWQATARASAMLPSMEESSQWAEGSISQHMKQLSITGRPSTEVMSALWQVMLHRVLQQALQAEDAGQQQARTQDPRTMLNPSFCTVRGLYQAVEVPVQQVLGHMEARGLHVAVAKLAQVAGPLEESIQQAKAFLLDHPVMRHHGWPEAALGDTKRLKMALYDPPPSGLNLAAKAAGRGMSLSEGNGTLTTTQDVLKKCIEGDEPLDDTGFVRTLLRLRKENKIRDYVKDLSAYTSPYDHNIGITILQTGAATGRLSCPKPNLMGLPKTLGAGEDVSGAAKLRDCIVARPGYTLVCADFSQIELRFLAYLSQDAVLTDAFKHGRDIHKETAEKLFPNYRGSLTPERRRQIGKVANFAIIYGQGERGLADDAGISLEEAKIVWQEHKKAFQAVHEFMGRVRLDGLVDGYTESMGGRRRTFPKLSGLLGLWNPEAYDDIKGYRNKGLKADIIIVERLINNAMWAARAADIMTPGQYNAQLREAGNMRLQGSSADLLKRSLLAVTRGIAERGYDAHLLLPVHDEVILEAREEQAEAVRQLVQDAMAGAMSLGDVPILVEAGVGPSWKTAKK